ncbi:uncharacterized protein LY89DRAFT_681896 [Mollisia scopiformis]|uniref:Chitin-binding type-4 domain-containing protein n=1 Tax=Mollisia scopiformis TaxID=149040 RepID=A0A194XMQ2_MOLSC|nr:uncharacterized protein LY89DRAFT_681896 [Mollisia scopiformis]KUJ21369.1 hypothetical protein LY89DRAFT_681896 [Mollisia scopiformis]
MQYTSTILATSAALITSVSAHGFLTSPQPRMPGSAMEAACGTQVYDNQASDNYGNIQGELQVAASQTDYNAAECDIWLCKGYKYADNTDNVQSWTAGQVVDMTFDIRAPHTGYANVSIVNTATNTIIGDMLLYYSDFADNAKTIPANETSFSITVPNDLGDTCSTAGACVLQHYWNAESIDQTYESCIDFTVGGSGSSSVSSSSPVVASSTSASSSVLASTSAQVVSSTPAAVVTSSSTRVSPSTLQTVVKSSSVVASPTSSAAVPTETPDDDDEC